MLMRWGPAWLVAGILGYACAVIGQEVTRNRPGPRWRRRLDGFVIGVLLALGAGGAVAGTMLLAGAR